MTLYDLVTTMTDKRLPSFAGAGIRREGAQIHFGRGKGMLFLSQVLYVQKINGKVTVKNTAY